MSFRQKKPKTVSKLAHKKIFFSHSQRLEATLLLLVNLNLKAFNSIFFLQIKQFLELPNKYALKRRVRAKNLIYLRFLKYNNDFEYITNRWSSSNLLIFTSSITGCIYTLIKDIDKKNDFQFKCLFLKQIY